MATEHQSRRIWLISGCASGTGEDAENLPVCMPLHPVGQSGVGLLSKKVPQAFSSFLSSEPASWINGLIVAASN